MHSVGVETCCLDSARESRIRNKWRARIERVTATKGGSAGQPGPSQPLSAIPGAKAAPPQLRAACHVPDFNNLGTNRPESGPGSLPPQTFPSDRPMLRYERYPPPAPNRPAR